MLLDAPPLCARIDNISLLNVEYVSIVIPSDTCLGGEVDIAFILFPCFGLGSISCPSALVPDGQNQMALH